MVIRSWVATTFVVDGHEKPMNHWLHIELVRAAKNGVLISRFILYSRSGVTSKTSYSNTKLQSPAMGGQHQTTTTSPLVSIMIIILQHRVRVVEDAPVLSTIGLVSWRAPKDPRLNWLSTLTMTLVQ